MRRSRANFDEADDFSCLRLHNAVLVCRDLDAACFGVANDASCLVRMVAQHSSMPVPITKTSTNLLARRLSHAETRAQEPANGRKHGFARKTHRRCERRMMQENGLGMTVVLRQR